MNTDQSMANRERVVRALNGWVVLLPLFVVLVTDVIFLSSGRPDGVALGLCYVILGVCIVSLKGFFSLQPNEARVLVLFGAYTGTVRTSGFHWANPFYSRGQSRSESRVAGIRAAELFSRPSKISLR